MSSRSPSQRPRHPAPESGLSASLLRWGLIVLGLLAGVGLLALLIFSGWSRLSEKYEEQMCRKFADLKNANDPRAEDYLGPRSVIPDHSVSRQEADQLDAESILRMPFHVKEVRPLRSSGPAHQFKLVVQGGMASDHVWREGGSRPTQIVYMNPDIIIEVRGGKIYGLRAQLHED